MSGGDRRIVCWGEVLWDVFPDGRRLGGAPANVAYHLATLGAEAALVSRIGEDEPGRAALAQLAAAGVDVGAVQRDQSRATGSVGVELSAGEARYRFQPDGAWEHIQWDAEAEARVTAAEALCFGTLSQSRPAARDSLAAALAAIGGGRVAHGDQPAGSATPRSLAVCDLNLRPVEEDPAFLRWILAAADVVKLNEREEAVLARLFGAGDVVGYLFDELGVRAVAVTRGASGCRIAAANPDLVGGGAGRRDVEQAAWPIAAGGDFVGCGDAFTAVLALGLVARAPLDVIAWAACRYAGAVAGQRGAMPAMAPELVAEIRAALRLASPIG